MESRLNQLIGRFGGDSLNRNGKRISEKDVFPYLSVCASNLKGHSVLWSGHIS